MQNLALLVLLPRANQCWLVAQYNCLEFQFHFQFFQFQFHSISILTFNSIVIGGFIYGTN